MTVCQLRAATSALVRSLWLTGQARRTFLKRTAHIITLTQKRLARSRHSHVRKKRKQLREAGIDLLAIRCCILET